MKAAPTETLDAPLTLTMPRLPSRSDTFRSLGVTNVPLVTLTVPVPPALVPTLTHELTAVNDPPLTLMTPTPPFPCPSWVRAPVGDRNRNFPPAPMLSTPVPPAASPRLRLVFVWVVLVATVPFWRSKPP